MNATEAMEVTGPSGGGTLENIAAFYGPAVKALEDVDRGADGERIKYAERQLKICNLRLSWATEIYMKEPNKDTPGFSPAHVRISLSPRGLSCTSGGEFSG